MNRNRVWQIQLVLTKNRERIIYHALFLLGGNGKGG